jgi:hypothetical protein
MMSMPEYMMCDYNAPPYLGKRRYNKEDKAKAMTIRVSKRRAKNKVARAARKRNRR